MSQSILRILINRVAVTSPDSSLGAGRRPLHKASASYQQGAEVRGRRPAVSVQGCQEAEGRPRTGG